MFPNKNPIERPLANGVQLGATLGKNFSRFEFVLWFDKTLQDVMVLDELNTKI